MKPYNERLQMIDEAIDYYKGKLPREANPDSTLIIRAYGRYYFISEEYFNTYSGEGEFVCYEEEFEQRAKELGWINGYKWGVEYKTNGKKPDLPDDVLVEVERAWSEISKYTGLLGNQDWCSIEKFRIVDERYKPKEQEMSDWYEKGELPPVGTECEYIIGKHKGYLRCTFVGLNSRGSIVIETVDGEYLTYHPHQIKFRPLCTETNKLIEQMMFHGCQSLTRKEATELVEKGYRKVKLMREDKFMQDSLKYFEMNQFTVSQFTLICEALRKLHSAGCRFIDQED